MEWNVISEDDDGVLVGLPGEEGEYLFTDGKSVLIAELCMDVDDDGQLVCWVDGWDIDIVTAWMPLPKPYNGGK